MKPYVYKNEENEPLKLVYLLLHYFITSVLIRGGPDDLSTGLPSPNTDDTFFHDKMPQWTHSYKNLFSLTFLLEK